ncbi:leucine-rich repeats and immunoglobulin-like domains protein sma-10 isoform X2 [Artemia franciscana]|uniref:leucine-rich repeats and immunoglobulin-like domains protein sma-10 isoform X2 n=1 Tax=Artemia franciscana TaxID=6661 RepID=UPI0032DA1684
MFKISILLFCVLGVLCLTQEEADEPGEDDTKDDLSVLECPPFLLKNATPLSPCICHEGLDDDAIFIECNGLLAPKQLKQITMKLGRRRIDALEIKESNLPHLIRQLLGGNAIETIFMRNNSINSVDPTAFAGSENLAQRIDLSANNIQDFKFEMFNQFSELTVLNLGENKLTKITSAGQIQNLHVLYLYMNKIETIEPGAFNLLEGLEYLDLRWNDLKQLPLGALTVPSPRWQLRIRNNELPTLEGAFQGVVPFLVEASYNSITQLKEEVYRPVLEGAMTEGAQLYLEGNLLQCDCDVAWLVTNITLRRFVDNAVCSGSMSNIQDLMPEEFETCQGFEPTTESV